MALRLASVLLIVLFASAVGSDAGDMGRPVAKVIKLLQDMVGQLTKEAKQDEEVKEEMDCWCETGRKEKTAAVSYARNMIGQLNSEIESLAASSAKLNTQIADLNKEIEHNTEALAKSTDMRKKQLAEFGEDEKSVISSVSAMKGAIEAIGAKHEGSFEKAGAFARTGARAAFLQNTASSQDNSLTEVIAAVQTQVRLRQKLITPHQLEVVTAFLKSPEEFVGQSALLQEGYNPEHTSSSGAIFGVLKGMKETFENDLAGSQADENKNQRAYEDLKAAKDTQILAAQSLVQTKDTELGNVDQRHAEAKQNLKDTENTLAADETFLANLVEQCANINAEFFERTTTRQQETQAVSKALAFLNSDDAKDLYARTFKSAAFLQTGMKSSVHKVVDLLSVAARKAQDSRLSALATTMLEVAPEANQADQFANKKEETFNQIKESIGDMIEKLVTEKEDARKHRDFCIDNIQLNERDTDTANRRKSDQDYKIEELRGHIAKLKVGIEDLEKQIFESRQIVKRASEDRERENTMFQTTIADQRATKKLLQGALAILKGFYKKANDAALAQVSSHDSAVQPAGAPPPPGFKQYAKSNTSGGVMGMMQQIIKDTAAMEEEAIKGEADSQVAFETLVNDTNKGIVEMQTEMGNLMENKALAASDKTQTEVENKNTVTDLGELRQANIDLHAGCDYAIKNFDSKNDARDSEIAALKESINIFSGGL